MTDNYTPLQRNTLDGLGPGGGWIYLKLCEKYQAHKSKPNEQKAFFAACNYEEKVGNVLDYILRNGPIENATEKVSTEVSEFAATRYYYAYLN